ncbi:MAG: response regulator transcription factor [Candidatus Kapabacteria bacterium]|nr:response regulator transcription factor [Candidatus Kapabacteria bacterium]
MIKALIADDHPIMREGLKMFLICSMDISIDEVEDGLQAIEYVKTHDDLDILILDISMPGLDGIDTLKLVKDIKPELPVLMLSAYSEDQYALRVIRNGASGYVMKTSATEELVNAVERIIGGGKYVSPGIADRLVDAFAHDDSAPTHHDLSDRELEVMKLLAAGKTVTQIAEERGLSVKTVSTYRTRLMEKMSFETNANITEYVVKNGLLEIG